jgi:Leucine-rich repeat (LRR) protein
VKFNTSFSPFDEKFTTCELQNIHFISTKGLNFANSTNDFAYNNMRVQFLDSTIENVPPNLFYTFTNLEILQMCSVGLRNLFTQSFEHAANLRVFHAFENKLTTLSANTFLETIKLEYLDLSHNKISIIHEDAFKGLDNLKELSLINNKISILDEQTFEPLKNLTWIWLDRNDIKIISLNLFVNSQKLIGINLTFNNISAVSPILFDKLPQLKFLFFEGNNCTAQRFVNTVIANNANVKQELMTCYQEYRLIVPNEEEKFQLKNVLRDAEKANTQCETDKKALLDRLETTRQQLANLQNKNGK